MIKPGKIFISLFVYWVLSMIIASFAVSLISHFVPYDNIDEYNWKQILLFESKYMFRTFFIILYVSFAFAFIGLWLNYFLYKFLPSRSLKYIIILSNLVLFAMVPILWHVAGYEINRNFFKYILPVYSACIISFGVIFLPKKEPVVSYQINS